MIKTVSVTAGTETKVEISGGYNVGVINRTTDMLYASKKSGISAGADDVAAIPAGESYVIRAADDTVYLLATAAGDVQLESIGVTEVFRIAAARSSSGGGEGGTVDEVARQAISSHANNAEIHLTEEKAIKAAATAISNPDLLDNSHFAVNQRGQEEYTLSHGEYCIDRWRAQNNVSVRPAQDGVEITSGGIEFCGIWQETEPMHMKAGDKFTASAFFAEAPPAGWYYQLQIVTEDYSSIAAIVSSDLLTQGYNSLAAVECPADGVYRLLFFVVNQLAEATTIKVCSAKVEAGTAATVHALPDPATELVKCQRYYQIHTTGDIDPVDLRPSMRTITDIREREDGNYEYIAEL